MFSIINVTHVIEMKILALLSLYEPVKISLENLKVILPAWQLLILKSTGVPEVKEMDQAFSQSKDLGGLASWHFCW